jgi:hypothetical protein
MASADSVGRGSPEFGIKLGERRPELKLGSGLLIYKAMTIISATN